MSQASESEYWGSGQAGTGPGGEGTDSGVPAVQATPYDGGGEGDNGDAENGPPDNGDNGPPPNGDNGPPPNGDNGQPDGDGAEACDPAKEVEELQQIYDAEKATLEAAQEALKQKKARLDKLGKASQEIEQILKQYEAGSETLKAKFDQCNEFIDCRWDHVQGEAFKKARELVEKVRKDYEQEVAEVAADCKTKKETLRTATRERKKAETAETEARQAHDANKALATQCVAVCGDLMKQYQEAESACDRKLMYFLLSEMKTAYEHAQDVCGDADRYRETLCKSWTALREAMQTASEKRDAEVTATAELAACEAKLTELTGDPRAVLVERIEASGDHDDATSEPTTA